MGLIDRLFNRDAPASPAASHLYPAIVARARQEHWYVRGLVPDTIDGRFDMIAALLSLVLLRVEAEPGQEAHGIALAEAFVDDMDPQLREIGLGDVVVGKHVGQMMGMLGGRLGAYREGLAAGSLEPAIVRNVYREHPPVMAALDHVRESLEGFAAALAATPADALLGGRLPQ